MFPDRMKKWKFKVIIMSTMRNKSFENQIQICDLLLFKLNQLFSLNYFKSCATWCKKNKNLHQRQFLNLVKIFEIIILKSKK